MANETYPFCAARDDVYYSCSFYKISDYSVTSTIISGQYRNGSFDWFTCVFYIFVYIYNDKNVTFSQTNQIFLNALSNFFLTLLYSKIEYLFENSD